MGPGAYVIKPNLTTPLFTMGSRFDSDIRNKDHLRPKKKDGPGPGSYESASSINIKALNRDKTVWGKSMRDNNSLPKNNPPPNNYNPVKFTEASHNYSFPKASKGNEL